MLCSRELSNIEDMIGQTAASSTLKSYSQVSIEAKEQNLRALLLSYRSVIVAFSGGVDSAYLVYVANEELGERALAVTGDSASYPTFQRELADKLTTRFGLIHEDRKSVV